MYERIHSVFEELDYRWKFSDGSRVPTLDEIKETLDKCRLALYDEPNEAQVSLGGLIVKKEADHYDVYMRMGELDE